ncbi:MAG: transcription elongation factor GreA, partial [Clostridia bacterium]|nr:transcription elongation factor GreA [Clostridia bacterium]
MAKQIIVSHEGLKKLQQELEHLKTVKRKEVAQAIQKARAYGDLSENSEYDEAKNEQAEIEGKIASLEATLENAIVLDDSELGTDKVNVGNKVTVHNIDADEDAEY